MGALFIPSNWKLMCRILLPSSSSPLHLHLGLRIPKRWHHQQLLEWISNTYQARDDPLKLIHRASKETTRYDRQIKKVRLGWTLQKRAQTPHGGYFWSNGFWLDS